MGNVSTKVYVKFRCAPLRIKKASGIFKELITTRRRTTTRVGWGRDVYFCLLLLSCPFAGCFYFSK